MKIIAKFELPEQASIILLKEKKGYSIVTNINEDKEYPLGERDEAQALREMTTIIDYEIRIMIGRLGK